MKKILLALVIVFLCGIIVADISVNKLLDTEVILNAEILKTYATSKIVFNDVIWNLLYERIKQFICILLCRITPLRNYISIVIIVILLFCLGFFTMSCVLAVGFVGILIGIASVFPHGVFYYGSYRFLCAREKIYAYQNPSVIPQKIVTYVLAILFFVTGCVLECVIGVHFIPWLIRLSMI